MTKIVNSPKLQAAAVRTARGALYGYRARLRAKMAVADAALAGVNKFERKYTGPAPALDRAQEKGKNDMKNVIALTLAVVAAAATLGAAGYYLYKKNREDEEYEDIIVDDALTDEDNYVNYEAEADLKESVADAAKTVISAAETAVDEVKGTVSDVVDSVAEFIDNAKE